MMILKILINCLELILFAYLGLAGAYIFIFAVLGCFPVRKKSLKNRALRKIAVLIPAYKEDQVIIESAKEALKQDYPPQLFDVVVIVDSVKPETIVELQKLQIILIEVGFNDSTKAKALNAGMSTLDKDYDLAVVLDADNTMEIQFLNKINRAFDQGFQVVQGHRVAKNLNTSIAVLDAVSEEINNHIFRKGHRVAGLSSALIGSGMAFDYSLFRQIMSGIHAVGGFDKELELKLLRARIEIEYLDEAYLEDEKVQNSQVFEKQRMRWLSAQWFYFRKFALDGFLEFLRHQNFDYFNKVYQMVHPPRIILIGFLTIISVFTGIAELLVNEWFSDFTLFGFQIWIILWLLTVVALTLSIPKKFVTKGNVLALARLPLGFWMMFRSLFRLRGVNKKFLHTSHGVDEE